MTLKVLTNSNTADYLNSDGLIQRYGTSEAGPAKGGEYRTNASYRSITLDIPDLTLLSTAGAPAIIDDVTTLPKGAFIRQVTVINTTIATSGSSTATLDIGTVKRDMATEGDYNGIVAAAALATFNSLGETVVISGPTSTAAGALVGTTAGTDSGGYYITANYNTDIFTAGAVKIIINYDFNGT